MKEVKPKSIMDFIAEDKSLQEKHTIEEYETSTYGIKDDGVKEAYESYERVKERLRM